MTLEEKEIAQDRVDRYEAIDREIDKLEAFAGRGINFLANDDHEYIYLSDYDRLEGAILIAIGTYIGRLKKDRDEV